MPAPNPPPGPLGQADPAVPSGATTSVSSGAAANVSSGATANVSSGATAGADELVDALLVASRAMVALAARSLADLDTDVTLPQFRALVVLASRGPQRLVDIAGELRVNPSTGSRMVERLARKGLVQRHRAAGDRRTLRLSLTPAGRRLVVDVMARRRAEISVVVADLPKQFWQPVIAGLRAFAGAVGEVPEQEWWLGWTGRGEPGGATGCR